MKKSHKPLIVVLLFLLVSLTAIFLISIGLKLKYEELTRKKVELEKNLRDENTFKIKLLADYQMYSDENTIETFAKENLGMIKRNKAALKIKINQEEIDKINDELKSEYE